MSSSKDGFSRGDRGNEHSSSRGDREVGYKRERERPSGASPDRDRGRAASDRQLPGGGERELERGRGGGGGGHGGRGDSWEAPYPGGKRGRYDDRSGGGGGDRFAPPPFQQGPPGGREPRFADGPAGRSIGGGERGRYDAGPRPFGGRGGFAGGRPGERDWQAGRGAAAPSEFRGPPGFAALLAKPAMSGPQEHAARRPRSASPPRRARSTSRERSGGRERRGSGSRSRQGSPKAARGGQPGAQLPRSAGSSPRRGSPRPRSKDDPPLPRVKEEPRQHRDGGRSSSEGRKQRGSASPASWEREKQRERRRSPLAPAAAASPGDPQYLGAALPPGIPAKPDSGSEPATEGGPVAAAAGGSSVAPALVKPAAEVPRSGGKEGSISPPLSPMSSGGLPEGAAGTPAVAAPPAAPSQLAADATEHASLGGGLHSAAAAGEASPQGREAKPQPTQAAPVAAVQAESPAADAEPAGAGAAVEASPAEQPPAAADVEMADASPPQPSAAQPPAEQRQQAEGAAAGAQPVAAAAAGMQQHKERGQQQEAAPSLPPLKQANGLSHAATHSTSPTAALSGSGLQAARGASAAAAAAAVDSKEAAAAGEGSAAQPTTSSPPSKPAVAAPPVKVEPAAELPAADAAPTKPAGAPAAASPKAEPAATRAAGSAAAPAGAESVKLSILGLIESLDHDLAEVQQQLQGSRADQGRLQQREAHIAEALERLESKPPKQPAASFDSGSEVLDVDLTESEESELEQEATAGAAGSAPRRRLRRLQHASEDTPMADASFEALAAFGVKAEPAAAAPAALQLPALTAQQAAAARAASAVVEEWEVWEPAAEDSGEEWGGRRGRGGRGGRGRGRRKKEREAEREAERRAARQQSLPPRQRLALRALASAASGISAESTVAEVLAQAQRQASAAHASLAPAVPDPLLVPAGSSDAPPLGTAQAAAAAVNGIGSAAAAPSKGAPSSKAAASGGGPIAALLAARRPDLSAFRVPSAAPAFEDLTDLPQYRRNLESHCSTGVGVRKVLRREFGGLLRKHVELAVAYRARYEQYKVREQERAAAAAAAREQQQQQQQGLAALNASRQGSLAQPLSPTTARTTSRGRSGDYIRSDYEEKQAIAMLQAIELVKHCTELPKMEILPPRQARWEAYEDRNRLISDPEGYDEASWFVRPWTEEERKVFADKFLQHHKDFPRIATFLPGRTVEEVVRLYYAIQRTDEFSQTRRKYLLRKRREQTESNKSARGLGGFMSMGGNSVMADMEMARQAEEQAVRGGGLGRSGSRGSGLNGTERPGRSRSRSMLVDAGAGPLAAAPIEFFTGLAPGVAAETQLSAELPAAAGPGRRAGRARSMHADHYGDMGEEEVAAAGMRRSRTAPTALGPAGALPVGGSLPAGLDQLPLDLPSFGSIPPMPAALPGAAGLANGLLPPTTSFGATGALAAAAAFSAADAAAAAMVGTPTAASAGTTPSAFAASAFAAPFGAASVPPPPPMPLPVPVPAGLAGPASAAGAAGTPSAAAAEAAAVAAAAEDALGLGGKKAIDPDLDARFCHAVRLFGRDLKAISAYLGNKTVAATRLYWSRHRDRLGLDAIMAERAAAGLGAEEAVPGAAAAAAALPNLQGWAPLLDQLQQQQQQQAGQGPAREAAPLSSAAALFAAAESQQQLAGPGGLPAAGQPLPLAATAEGGSLAATPAVTPRARMSEDEVAADVARCAVAAAIAAHDGPPTARAASAAAAAAAPAAAAAVAGELGAAALPAAAVAAAGEEGAAVNAAVSSAAASLLPHEELGKLQGLLQPGGLLFEFAGGPEQASQLRELLRNPEQLLQHTGHMQQLMGMVEAAKQLLTASDATTPPLPSSGGPTPAPSLPPMPAPLPVVPPAPVVPAIALAAQRPPGSAFHLLAPQPLPLPVAQPQPTGAGRRGGGRKRKGE
ncbi:hypothetical protein ABPG75_007216 [Micractinium tetrahymenae]